MKFKGQYRILPELDKETNDFPRDALGNIDETYNDIYISCANGNRIYAYGKDGSRVALMAYIPSLIRGRSIRKSLDQQDITYTHYFESDAEVTFRFSPKNLDVVATLMKAKTLGANISPFSSKNLPKSNVQIPLEKMQEYKDIIASVDKGDLLILRRITDDFMIKILSKSQRKIDRHFNYEVDMRRLKMARQAKEYIYTKGMWDEYLSYLKRRVKQFYNSQTQS